MIILFLSLQITRSDIRPHIKWAVSLVMYMVTLIFLGVLCGYLRVSILTSSTLMGEMLVFNTQTNVCHMVHLWRKICRYCVLKFTTNISNTVFPRLITGFQMSAWSRMSARFKRGHYDHERSKNWVSNENWVQMSTGVIILGNTVFLP